MMSNWSYRSLPELSGLSPAGRERVWERCVSRAWRDPPAGVRVGIAAVFAAAVAGFAITFFPRAAFVGSAGVLAAVCLGAAGFLSVWRALFATARRFVPDELRGYCARCGYDLRATPGRCPECGTVPPIGARPA